MAETKEAKKVYTLDEIKYNEANKTNAVLACIPLIGLIMLFVEKEDLFVKYMGAQSSVVLAISFALSLVAWIPILGWLAGMVWSLASLVLVILAIVKTLQGERFDMPVVSDLALKVMGWF